MEYKEIKEVLRRIRKSIREERVKKYPPKLTRRGRPRLYSSESEGERVRYWRRKVGK